MKIGFICGEQWKHSIEMSTCDRNSRYFLEYEDHLLAEALKARGAAQVENLVWNDPGIAWSGLPHDLLMIRSCWDYWRNFAAFSEWLNAREAEGLPLFNPPSLLRSNINKTYLAGLARLGVRTIPTAFAETADRASIAAALAQIGNPDSVFIKPSISAGGDNSYMAPAAEAEETARLVAAKMVPAATLMLQPFFPEVREEGEWSLIYYNGAFSHAAIKRPKPGGVLVHEHEGGATRRITPPPELIREGEYILSRLPVMPLYARVDGLRANGAFHLMELEMTEPSFYFSIAPEATATCADAIMRRAQLLRAA